MTGTATFDEITLNEIEWRSHAVMADAAQTIVRVVKQSRIAQRTHREILYGQVLFGLRNMSGLMRDLLDIYHAPDAIIAIEAATPDQLSHIVEMMRDVHDKIDKTMGMVHPTRYWRSLYRPHLAKLKAYNDELESHTRAFCANDSALILLTKGDQDQLVEALFNPPEPNAALRRAFGRK
jgi:hypothetical protein